MFPEVIAVITPSRQKRPVEVPFCAVATDRLKNGLSKIAHENAMPPGRIPIIGIAEWKESGGYRVYFDYVFIADPNLF